MSKDLKKSLNNYLEKNKNEPMGKEKKAKGKALKRMKDC